ncbi:MAG: hypothetical protein AB8B88_03425 [Devosiaceae bacterium]
MASGAAPKPIEPIWVVPPPRQRLDPIERWFTVLLRFIALVLTGRAIFGWFIVIEFLPPAVVTDAMTANPTLYLSLLVIVSAVSVIAGVGLWLLAPWGAVLWLALVAADALLFFLLPEMRIVSVITVLLNAGLISIYLGMLLQVRRHNQQAATL